jgi:CheY-like chemotaxis protein
VRVLLVEDDDDFRELVTLVLVLAGATVIAVASVRAALEAFEQSRPHVMVTDAGLPGRDGWNFIEAIRARSAEEGGTTPALALTGYTTQHDIDHSLASGFDMHLAKPVRMETLVAALAQLAGRAGSADT